VQVKIVPGYEGGQAIGQRKLFCCYGTGPKSYSQTTGDVVSVGPGVYIDDFLSDNRRTVSGTYYVVARYTVAGTTRATWSLHWYTTGGSTEVSNGVDLSGESLQFSILGGDF
jgi:hypothetical protein